MNIKSLQINDENIIEWTKDNGYFIYLPELASKKIVRIKVKVFIDDSYKTIYFNKLKLLEYIENIVLKSEIEKVPIHWDSDNEKYFIYIKNNKNKYKIFVNIFIDVINNISNKRKILNSC